MSQYFWEGFEKRAVNVKGLGQTVVQGAKNLGGKVKSFFTDLPQTHPGLYDEFGKPMMQAAQGLGQHAADFGHNLKDQAITGFKDNLLSHAKTVGGKTGDYIYQTLEHIGKNLNTDEAWKALQSLGETVGLTKRAPTLLERAGQAVKEHPYLTGGLGMAGAGGIAYGLGRSGGSQPQQHPGGQQGYQYYNPYN